MGKLRSVLPSPALVVGIVALVAAVAGTAVAHRASTSAKQVTVKRVKRIANQQINNRLPLKAANIANGAITTAKLASGAVKAGQLGTVTVRNGTEEILQDGTGGTADAHCNPGERLIAGGAVGPNAASTPGWALYDSSPTDNGWRARARNNTGGQEGFYAVALCLQAG
jgi:hypothetical protein